MTKARTYACPGTARHAPHKFEYLHHPSVEADPLPRFCGICGHDSEADGEPGEAVTAPHIARPIRKTVDDMHRQMEAGAEFRANIAREHHGMDAEDVANMKMTDMKDHLYPGDTSEVEVRNPVTEAMTIMPQQIVGMNTTAGMGFSTTVSQGPYPNMGAHTMAALRQQHARFTATAGQAGVTTSSLPAFETTLPSYRKRVG
jgi:hypothetical protein